MADRVRFLAFGCPHVPLADPEAVAWLVDRVGKIQPDLIVHMGDGHEADSASRWSNEYGWSLADEFAAHNRLLAQLRKAAPRARRVFLWGNHDANLLSINRIDRRVRSLCDPRDHEPELAEWKHIPYVYCRVRGVFRVGQVTFCHGYEHTQSAGRFQSVLLGHTHGLLVFAHTHRPEEVTQVRMTQAVPLPYWYANVGCMRDLKPRYVERQRTHNWGHGIVTGIADDLKSPRMARAWDARTEIFRMYDEWAQTRQGVMV